jgi:hypothetical protein
MSTSKKLLLSALSLLVLTTSAFAGEVTVTVKSGDTLQMISQEYFGTTRRWPDILSWNHTVIKDDRELVIGMKLTIKDPKVDVAAYKAAAQAGSAGAADGAANTTAANNATASVNPRAGFHGRTPASVPTQVSEVASAGTGTVDVPDAEALVNSDAPVAVAPISAAHTSAAPVAATPTSVTPVSVTTASNTTSAYVKAQTARKTGTRRHGESYSAIEWTPDGVNSAVADTDDGKSEIVTASIQIPASIVLTPDVNARTFAEFEDGEPVHLASASSTGSRRIASVYVKPSAANTVTDASDSVTVSNVRRAASGETIINTIHAYHDLEF